MKKLNKLFAILFAVLGVGTLSAQNWTDITNGDANTFTVKYANPTNDDAFETWTGSGNGHSFDWNQTVTNIPDGVYELSANAMYRASLTYGTPTNCVLYATVGDYEYTAPIANFGDFTANESRANIETQMKNNDAYKSKIGNIIVENGEAKIGIKSIGQLAWCTNGYWFVCRKSTFSFKNVTETYFTGLQEKINRMLASAVESGAKTVLNTALATYNTATVENIKGLQAAITEFMQTASTTNPIDVTSYMANPSFEEGAVTYWYQDLGYTQNSNRDIKQPTGWNLMYSSAKVGNTQYQSFMPTTDGAKDGNCLYVRHKWTDVYAVEELRQSVKELPAGQYKLVVSVKGGASVVDANTLTLSAGNNTKTTVISEFDKTNYQDYDVTVTKTTDEATLDICYGLKQLAKGNPDQRYYIDDFRLYYLGEDLSVYKDMYDAAHDKAIAARDNDEYINVTGLERTNLNDAINQTIAEATKDAYLKAISVLETATTEFTASKGNYDELLAEKEIAIDLGMSDEAISSAAATTKTGLVALQDLKVAEYNYVKDEFAYPVELEASAWVSEGPTGSKNEQHWSGESSSYLEQSSEAWGWDAWTISYKQDLTLPSGDYVFKVAGRRASGTGNTLSLVVTNINDSDNTMELGSVNDFPEGDTGLGINKNGVTSFDANDEAGFANNGIGRGWQWRYVKFTLSSETKVRIAVNAEATTNHQWVGFCDATLQMTEETYLEANKHGLDAPTADAQALVDTKPMGTAENNALKAALNMTYTTGAELLAKIDALNTAVANANAWVATYNEAKAPLVTALERFEADFNLGNGLHGYMKNGLWANVLDQVQAAAIAKDVTDSYDGFAAAAEELNATLDAAQASINMYANLAVEISYAEAYTPVVAENADGHTDAIEVAQAAYDAAEIDDASTLILGMQNYRVLDYIHVTKRYTEIELGEWTGKTNSGSGEHWSGDKEKTYFDYSKWSGDHINGANEATQTITLPAGEYVLMAAGRAANVAGTEAYIKVNDTKVNFAAKGAYGYGIATDGTANYAANGTYGRDNEGYGWEYRFITFTLTEEAEVTLVAGMTIDVNTADLSWAGVCTPVLYKRTATEVNLVITEAEWATFMLPFDAELPDGVKAYSCDEVADDALVLEEAENFVANTPYLVNGAEGTYSFNGYSIAEEDSYTVGLFTGTYVDYTTTAGSNTYVLQKNDDVVAFYLVGEEIQPTVGAYHCYLTVPAGTAEAPMFSISRGEDTTGIENATLNAQPSTVIYDLMGRKVTTMVKGNMYIVNGKKVIVK